MVSNLFFYQVVLIALVWLFLLLSGFPVVTEQISHMCHIFAIALRKPTHLETLAAALGYEPQSDLLRQVHVLPPADTRPAVRHGHRGQAVTRARPGAATGDTPPSTPP